MSEVNEFTKLMWKLSQAMDNSGKMPKPIPVYKDIRLEDIMNKGVSSSTD